MPPSAPGPHQRVPAGYCWSVGEAPHPASKPPLLDPLPPLLLPDALPDDEPLPELDPPEPLPELVELPPELLLEPLPPPPPDVLPAPEPDVLPAPEPPPEPDPLAPLAVPSCATAASVSTPATVPPHPADSAPSPAHASAAPSHAATSNLRRATSGLRAVVAGASSRPFAQSRPCHVATSTTLPSASTSDHHCGAKRSPSMRPPAARMPATRSSATSCGTETSTWIRLRGGRWALCWNHMGGAHRRGSSRSASPAAR